MNFQISPGRMVFAMCEYHLTIHPSSNALVERAVKTFKEEMKKTSNTGSIKSQMARMLFQYWMTRHSTTGVSPAELATFWSTYPITLGAASS